MQMPSQAQRAFRALCLLGLVVAALLCGWLGWQTPHLVRGVWLACQSAAQTIASSWAFIGLLLPGALLGLGLLLGLRALVSQLVNTRRLLQHLHARQIPLPDTLLQTLADSPPVASLRLVADANPFAFTAGFRRPQIWLSSGLLTLLSYEEVRAVVHHEQYHVQQRDPWRMLWARALAQALFFLPLASTLRDDFLEAKEQEADRAVAAGHELAAALLKLVRFSNALPPASIAAVAASPVALRIHRLLDPTAEPHRGRMTQTRRLLATLLLATLVTSVSLVSTHHAATPPVGGKCGYIIQPHTPEPNSTPATFTPAY